MKHTIITLAIMMAAAAITPASAQKDYKFGKMTKTELLRTDFPDIVDGAKMVILDEYIEANLRNNHEWGFSSYAHVYDKCVRTIEYFDTKKIKIIAPNITGNTEITFTLTNNETLMFKQIKVAHYSLHNNRLVKHKYSAKEIKTTVLPDNSTRYSFSVPATQAGDVLEFTYSKRINLTNDESYDLTIQQDMPILNIRCDLASPRKDDDIDKLNDFYKTIFREGRYKITESASTGMKPYTTHPHGVYNDDSGLRNNKYEVILSDIFIYEATNLPAITDESDGEIAKIRVIFNSDSPE